MRTNEKYGQYLEEQQIRETIFRDYPEIQKFEQAKSKWMRVLLYFMLIFRMLNITLLIQTSKVNPILMIGAGLGGYCIYACILFMGMKGRKNRVFFLCLLLLSIINTLLKNFRGITSLDMLIQLHVYLFRDEPITAVLYVMLYAGVALHIGVFIWMEVIPKNRRLAKQYDTLMESGGAENGSSSISTVAKWTANEEDDEE
ncbi:MAG: hypothetical protein K2N73_11260 [Lachnospiraceae bacterium]|nr:hypothetical protein [Lachnospiraceae bacterium]